MVVLFWLKWFLPKIKSTMRPFHQTIFPWLVCIQVGPTWDLQSFTSHPICERLPLLECNPLKRQATNVSRWIRNFLHYATLSAFSPYSPTSYMSFHHDTMHFALAWTHLLLLFGIVGKIIQQSLKCGRFFNSLISMAYQYSNLNYENSTSKVATDVIGEIFNQLYKYVPVSLLIFDWRKWWYL